MSIACAALMCHAPIVIPAISGAEAPSCKRTTQAMRETARALVQHEPGLVVLISPHAPRRPRSIGIVFDATLQGDFSRFGHAELSLTLRGAPTHAARVAAHARAERIATHAFAGTGLDHGSTVPLFFLSEAGYRGRVLLTSLPYPGSEIEAAFGKALCAAALEGEERWAVLASGDMSHRLSRSAPAGFDPRAREFDQGFVHAIGRGDLRGAVSFDPELVELAAEDVVQSTAVAAAAVDYCAQGTRVIAYEAPFGVGYLEALLFSLPHARRAPEPARSGSRAEPRASTSGSRAEPRASTPPYALIEVALDAIEHALSDRPYAPPRLAAPWDHPRPVFVTLRGADGELRGCIGRTEASRASLAEEVADCAVGAATRDYRMQGVRPTELASLQIEISVLQPPEPIESEADLDPARFGIVVEHGTQRGVLLPNVEGIDTVAKQLEVALRKAAIADGRTYRVRRFAVNKVVRTANDAATRTPFSRS